MATIGKGIITPVAIICAVVFMGLFVFVSVIFSSPSATDQSLNKFDSSLLLGVTQSSTGESLIFDELYNLAKEDKLEGYHGSDIYFNNFILTKEIGNCLIIYNEINSPSNIIFQCEVVEDKTQNAEDVIKNGKKNKCSDFATELGSENMITIYGPKLNHFSFATANGKTHNVIYYYGNCLERYQK